jgi:hypothetical protein
MVEIRMSAVPIVRRWAVVTPAAAADFFLPPVAPAAPAGRGAPPAR